MRPHLRPAHLARAIGLLTGLTLLLAACGTERDVGGDTGGQAAAEQDCQGATAEQEKIAKVWHDAQKALGVPETDPPDQEVCQVDTGEFAAEAPYRVGFASQGPTNSWALTYDEALKDKAKAEDVELLYASANGDAATQVNNIQDLLAQQPDALIVTPMGSAIQGQINRAAEQGVPVVICTGRLEDDSGVVSTVNRSYELQGTIWAQWIVEKLGGKGKVAMLSGIAGVPTAEFQYQAARKVFDATPGIEVVTRQFTNWSPTDAKTVAQNLVVSHPDLNAIWSDSGISNVGVIQAYGEAGKPVPPLTGDTSNAFLRAATQHAEATGQTVEFATSAYPPEQSVQCLDTALKILSGEPVPSLVSVESAVFTHEQLDEYYREECSDNLWIPSQLTDEQLKRLELC